MAGLESIVAARILTDLQRLDRSVIEIEHGLHASTMSEHRRFILGGVALALQGMYSGLERTFQLIAEEIDHATPRGDRWHQQLLKRMASETERRSAVVSETSAAHLNEMLEFRHVIRNIYAYELDYDRVEALAREFGSWFATIRLDLLRFAAFLDDSV